ncbi:hypothetical protein OG215_36685 (plasmid) [Streptomyces globisporus]|uniref:hypothetical protein n=1 Tax=Streptomyces globisporus TaxID=1908 RepID=UPI002F912B11|nr:hypothetical protein OG215_36685 [Streptomyces globisporus]
MDTPTDFIGEIHRLITVYQEQSARHHAATKQYYNGNGALVPALFIEHGWEIPSWYANYQEDLDREAYDGLALLRTVMGRLLELAGPPVPGQAFTLTYAGPERHDGEAPYAFVVNGADIADARRRLELLPFFRQWCEERREDTESEPDVEFLDEDHHSHAGLFCPYIDLRHEQSAVETDDVEGTPAVPLPRQEG